MIISFILVLFILCVNPFSLLSILKPATYILHTWCLERVQTEEQWIHIYSALICGEKLPNGNIKQTFITLGIIHLMVISGAHLIFIEKIWNLLPIFRFKKIFLTLFLLIYSLSAGLNPPILRALFSLLIARINKEVKFFWSPYLRVQICGLLCLLCQSSWLNSISLQLSWLASMGMSNHKLSRLKSCTLTFILILPIIGTWGNTHPFSIIINWLITPLASCVLLPLSLLIIPFPFMRPVTDWIWTQFISGINLLKPLIQHNGIDIPWSLNTFEIWVYICCVSIILQIYFVYSVRKKCNVS